MYAKCIFSVVAILLWSAIILPMDDNNSYKRSSNGTESGDVSKKTKVDFQRMLYKACKTGDLEQAQNALANSANPFISVTKSNSSYTTALIHGHVNIVRFLIDSSEASIHKNNYHDSPLCFAVAGGHKDLVHFLLERGAPVRECTSDGNTPLHYAALNGDVDIATILINAGADINELNNAQESALMFAVKLDPLAKDIIEFLISQGANVQSAFAMVMSKEWHEPARLLFLYGAIPVVESDPGDLFQHKPFQCAASCGDPIKSFLEKEQSAEALQEALMYAAGRGHLIIVNELLQAGADPSHAIIVVSRLLRIPEMFQQNRNNYQTILNRLNHHIIPRLSLQQQILLNRNPQVHLALLEDINLLPTKFHKYIRTPEDLLLEAAHAGTIMDLKNALDAGAHVNCVDHKGRTALWLAALRENSQIGLAMVKLLLLNKLVAVNPCDNRGFSLLAVLQSLPKSVIKEKQALITLLLDEARQRGVLGHVIPPLRTEALYHLQIHGSTL